MLLVSTLKSAHVPSRRRHELSVFVFGTRGCETRRGREASEPRGLRLDHGAKGAARHLGSPRLPMSTRGGAACRWPECVVPCRLRDARSRRTCACPRRLTRSGLAAGGVPGRLRADGLEQADRGGERAGGREAHRSSEARAAQGAGASALIDSARLAAAGWRLASGWAAASWPTAIAAPPRDNHAVATRRRRSSSLAGLFST